MLQVLVPGGADLSLEHLVLDANGTLSDRGELIPRVGEALGRLRGGLALHLLSADTFGTAEALAAQLGAAFGRVESGVEKTLYIERLGAASCVAVGNGRNDVAMLEAAALGIAVLGPEGTAGAAVAAADVVARSVEEALVLLGEPKALMATLRA
jgi:soluble P-type ATPase